MELHQMDGVLKTVGREESGEDPTCLLKQYAGKGKQARAMLDEESISAALTRLEPGFLSRSTLIWRR